MTLRIKDKRSAFLNATVITRVSLLNLIGVQYVGIQLPEPLLKGQVPLKYPANSYASPANNRYCVDIGCFPEQTL